MESKKILKSPLIRNGLPVVLFCVGGMVGLTKLVQGKKDIEDLQKGRRVLTTREFDLEEDYKKTLAKLNIDEYEVVRIPRPSSEE